MNWLKCLALAALAASIAGCNTRPVGVGGKENPKAYASIVSLSPSTTEYLFAEGASPNLLAGRSASCDRPQYVLDKPIVTKGTEPDYEKLNEIKPDLIIYDKSLYSDDTVAKLKALGYELLEYNATDFKSYEDFGYRLASKLSIESGASLHIDGVYRELSLAQANKSSHPRTTVLLGSPKDGNYLVMGLEGMHSFIIKSCGGTPVGAEGKLFQEAKIESLIDWNPEVIYSDEHAQELYNDPRLQGIDAVKNQHVYDFEAETLVRIGGKLDGVIKIMAKDISKMPINARKAQ